MNTETNQPLVSVRDLKVHYRQRSGMFGESTTVKAVDGVSLDIARGETLGLVGESGCGKSTLGRAIVRLAEATEGSIEFDGRDLGKLSGAALRRERRHLQMIFQDPYSSLNPRMTVGDTIAESLTAFGRLPKSEIKIGVDQGLDAVGLKREYRTRYPSEFSGGQRQRISIARALATDPKFIVADEPISALDVSIQAQILNLLGRLKAEKQLTYLFISHDLRAVRHLSDRIAVMYLGKIVELGPADAVYRDPLMPYTQALISAVPVANPFIERTRTRIVLRGDLPSPANPPTGCTFHTRCPYAIPECSKVVPKLVEIESGHFAACIRLPGAQAPSPATPVPPA